jgi:hypothetical protein
VFSPPVEDPLTLEAERAALEQQLGNLTDAIKEGGDIPMLVAALKSTNAQLVNVRRRMEPQEQHHDREQLRAALEQRVEEWRGILRKHPAQGRQVIAHLLGPITITTDLATIICESGVHGFDPHSRRGKEGITAADVRDGLAVIRWEATTKPMGLLAGMSAGPRMASPTGKRVRLRAA